MKFNLQDDSVNIYVFQIAIIYILITQCEIYIKCTKCNGKDCGSTTNDAFVGTSAGISDA